MLRRIHPSAWIAALAGLGVGLLLGLGFGRSFDAGFWTALAGAIVGGVLAVIASYLGSRELIDRDDERERKDLIGAVQATRSEMSTNGAVVKDLIEKQFVNFASVRLYDADYRQVITTLARGLPMDLFAEVSVTANGVRRAASMLDYDQRRGGGITGETVEEINRVAKFLPDVNKRLLAYARDVLGIKIAAAENPFEGA